MFVRVVEPGKSGFQLRKGEDGLSVFDLEVVDPALTEDEILANFRPGNVLDVRSREEIEAKGLRIIYVAGGDSLPPRLRAAHAEIRPLLTMSRGQFKQALKELE